MCAVEFLVVVLYTQRILPERPVQEGLGLDCYTLKSLLLRILFPGFLQRENGLAATQCYLAPAASTFGTLFMVHRKENILI